MKFDPIRFGESLADIVKAQIAPLREEIANLKAENAMLRESHQSMKKALAGLMRCKDAVSKHMIIISDGDPTPPSTATLNDTDSPGAIWTADGVTVTEPTARTRWAALSWGDVAGSVQATAASAAAPPARRSAASARNE